MKLAGTYAHAHRILDILQFYLLPRRTLRRIPDLRQGVDREGGRARGKVCEVVCEECSTRD